MRVIRLILLITILIFAVNVVEAKTYIVNFDYIGGVEVKTDSPFPPAPKAWRDTEGSVDGQDNWKPINYGDPHIDGETAYTQSEIDAIERLDGNYVEQSASVGALGGDEYAVHHFRFSVATAASYMRIGAYLTDQNDGVEMYIWNWNTGDWEQVGTRQYPDGYIWFNFTCSSQTECAPYINSSTGQVDVVYISGAEGAGDDAYIRVDYVEAYVIVPDSAVHSACLKYKYGTLRDWDGIFDDDQFSITFRVEDKSGNGISNYPGFIRLIWDSSYSDFAANWSNSSGYLTTAGKPIHGRVSDKWRVTFKGVIKDVMTNGVAYQYDSSCSDPIAVENVAITPGSYDIVLVGRYWDNTGGDWAVFRWVADPEDVEHVNKSGYDIPAAQKFRTWDLLYWKLGVPDPNHDDDGLTEGVYGTSNDVDYETQPACIGPDSSPDDPRYCGYYICQDDGRCCYNDADKDHDCSLYLSGYRFGPIIEINAPDHALGVVVANTISLCENINTIADLMAQPYDAHEGGGEGHEITCRVLGGNMSTITSEYAFHEGYVVAILRIFYPDPHEGFGLPGFIGLMPDSEHVVGVVLGHRYGIHPFVSLVTSMPSSEIPVYDDHTNTTAKSIWESQEFYRKWVYYLLRNTAYSIKVTAEELWNWDKRYPNSGEDNIVLANLALNDLFLDLLPFLDEVLWTIQVTGNNSINTFIITTFTNLYGNARIVSQIVSNSTLLSEFENVVGTAIENLPKILGPPDGSTGLNYLLKYRAQIPYSDRENFTAKIMELSNNAESLLISVLKNLPPMENSTDPYYPGWNYGDWVADGHT